jgi:hypothetical protein
MVTFSYFYNSFCQNLREQLSFVVVVLYIFESNYAEIVFRFIFAEMLKNSNLRFFFQQLCHTCLIALSTLVNPQVW